MRPLEGEAAAPEPEPENFANSDARSFSTWITRGPRAIPARISLPPGNAYGALLIIAPCGVEFTSSYRVVHAIRQRAVEAGFAVCLPDLTGHGDSWSADGISDLAGAWAEDAEGCLDELADRLPDLPRHIVGLRLGAAIAFRADREANRIYVNPIGGRSFLRYQRLLKQLTYPPASAHDNSWEIPCLSLSEAQAASIRNLTIPASIADADIVIDDGFTRSQDDYPGDSVIVPIDDQSVRRIVASMPRALEGVPAAWPQVCSTLIDHEPGGAVLETFRMIGPNALVAIETRPLAVPSAGVGLVFTAMGAELRSGPGAAWTICARRAAAQGISSIRADRRLIGDMVNTSESRSPNEYTEEAAEDVREAIRALDGADVSEVAVVGVCAGAWLSMRAAHHARVSAAISINSLLWSREAKHCYKSLKPGPPGSATSTTSRSDVDLSKTSLATFLRKRISVSVLPRLKRISARHQHLRSMVLTARGRGFFAPVLSSIPTRTRTIVVLGNDEHSLFRRIGGTAAIRTLRVARRQRIELMHAPCLDHAVHSEKARSAVIDLIIAEAESLQE